MRSLLPLGLLALALGLALAAGPAPFGRLALSVGMPSLAAGLVEDPNLRGVALYRLGRYYAADRAFAEAGLSATFNRGDTLAATGRYPDAVAYFDAALFADPDDADARFNRELVARLVPTIVGTSNEIDGVPATVETDSSRAQPTKRDVPQAETLIEQQRVLDPRVGRAIAASEEWLATLPDDPGLYLKKRLRAEYEHRQDLGLANPPEDTAW